MMFKVKVWRRLTLEGTYELEAPDEEAAYVLAADISLGDKRIKWEDEPQRSDVNNYPRESDIYVEEKYVRADD